MIYNDYELLCCDGDLITTRVVCIELNKHSEVGGFYTQIFEI